MKLGEYTVTDFSALLASDKPAPGGGSAAVLEGALGAALTAMVCQLTAGKARYAEHQELTNRVQTQMEDLRRRLLELMEQDTEAFLLVSSAFALPKETGEEKAARSAAIQRGLERCVEVPLEGMALAAQGLELAHSIWGKCNDSAASDLGVAALSLRTALLGTWLNVLINLKSLKDRALAEQFLARGRGILDAALPLAEGLYGAIETSLL